MGDTDRRFDGGGAGPTSSAHAVIRVDRGRATNEELAAVTLVLLSLLAAQGEAAGAGPTPAVPQWRPERARAAYRSPYNWR
ncbi:acyl-CoA carboxylase epsilon subunit [Streptomyces sp. NK08204]|uniref:acyl-CoA carboxylase epsilon subunit n=1 Tax=Streptomyces sp. NK08204 TaxID=2873260 RepID=UPI001CEC1D11|nr:acyl-CoA carboxylase epsilon subunit [Streptomyces sp. NK08204]